MSLHTTAPAQPDLHLNDPEQPAFLPGNPPSWMMRYGIGTMAGFFALVLGLGYFIQYPDVVSTTVTLTTACPPIRVMAKSGGRITELMARPDQSVVAGEVLAVLENTAHWQDVLRLEHWLEHQAGSPQSALPEGLSLGELQEPWSAFVQHWKDYRFFSTNGHTAARIAALQQQIGQLKKINGNIWRQKTILREEFALNTKERDRQNRLYAQGVIAAAELEKTETAWLQQKRQLESAEANTLQNQMQIKQLQNQINELSLTDSDNNHNKSLTLAEDVHRLVTAVQAWKQRYLVTAPISGKVSLGKVWSVQQSVEAGVEVLAIVPESSDTAGYSAQIVGRANVGKSDMGKISPGSRAIVRLDAYPAQQYGTLEGFVRHISALPQDETGYALDIALPDSLYTSYAQVIPFRQEMSGQLRIITEERRALARVFEHILDLLKNR